MGLTSVKPRAVLRFNQYDQVIQAAAAAQGIALGRSALVRSMLAEGRLAALGWWEPKQGSHGYWLVCAEDRPRAEVIAVKAWITDEASA